MHWAGPELVRELLKDEPGFIERTANFWVLPSGISFLWKVQQLVHLLDVVMLQVNMHR
jgi:hypothetical protein